MLGTGLRTATQWEDHGDPAPGAQDPGEAWEGGTGPQAGAGPAALQGDLAGGPKRHCRLLRGRCVAAGRLWGLPAGGAGTEGGRPRVLSPAGLGQMALICRWFWLPSPVTPMGLGRAVPPRGPGCGSHRANKPSRGLWIFAIIVQLQLQGPRHAAMGLRSCQEVEVPGQH